MAENLTAVYGVYIRTDDERRIISVNSEGLLKNLDGWIKIDEYVSDTPYAQGDYFGDLIVDDRGVWRYAYDPNSEKKWRERTQEEMDADAALLVPQISETDAALLELAAMIADLMAGVAELGALLADEAIGED